MSQLVQNLMESGYLKSPEIIKAFQKIDRADFVPQDMKEYAYEDRPLPIGFGQTISQPAVVVFMLELLHPKRGDRILDVGSGSGWQTALLAEIVGKKGEVTAIERIEELYESGKRNCEKYGFRNIKFMLADATKIVADKNYFDGIIAAASSRSGVPQAIKDELRIGGKMVIPIEQSIFVFTKKSENDFSAKEYPGFLFVPLIKE